METIPAPHGMDSNAFAEKVNNIFQNYKNVDYAPVPSGNKGNSNSLIGSILRKAGSDYRPNGSWMYVGWDQNVIK